jgi:hypothetical protein
MWAQRIPAARSVEVFNRLVEEVRRVFVIFVYLWALFSLFALHKGIIVREGMISGQVLAIVNAFILAKVMFIAARYGLGDIFRERPLIYPVLFKSVVFALLLVTFYVAEETAIGTLLKGETFAESFPQIGGGGAIGLIATLIILFVVLIPFFAFQELGRVIGSDMLFDIFFKSPRNKPVPETTGPISGAEAKQG